MSLSKKSRRSRPNSKKTRQSSTTRRTHPKKNRLLLSVSKAGLPQICIPMDSMPQFLIKAKAAVDAERTVEAIELLNDEAVEVVRKIVEKDPSQTDVMLVIAVIFSKTGQLRKAEEWYKKILEQEPHAFVYNELARICRYTGRLSQAIQYRRKTVEVEPDWAVYLSNLGCDLVRAGQKQEGVDVMRKAIEMAPGNAAIHSGLLFYLHHLPNLDPQAIFDEHKQWGRIHAPISRARVSHGNVPDPDRRLRVGYVSPDFCAHSVASFFESLLDEHDAGAVETYGYGNVVFPDGTTERIKRKLDHYRNVSGVDCETLSNMVEADQIDILVDLSGHTANNNLAMFAYKPAPIQVTYLGYPNTTGMQQMDYRFTDELADAPESQQFYTEELVFLPEGFLCYRPADFAPGVAPPPAVRKGHITFGSFNNSTKINPFLIALWAEVLNASDNSRLLLKFNGGDDQEVRDYYFRDFEKFGIGRERVKIIGQRSPVDHLRLYGLVDIALDTYPYNGTTTTCEALWMGVPVVSLTGRCHVSKVGLSILSRVGLEFFVASTPKDYLAKITALASKPDALAEIRVSMRKRIADSTLCDAKTFVRSVEAAYRKMWHKWCRCGTKPVLLGEHQINTDEKTEQSTMSVPADHKRSGPPQFLIDATAAVNAGQADKAIHILKDAIPQDSFTASSAIGEIYLSLNQNEKALEWLQRARKCRPDSTMVIAGIGRALAGLGRRIEAVEELTKAMKVQPNIEDVHLLAEAMLQIQTPQTVELLRQIVEKNPSRMDAVFELAKALEKSGQLDEAEEWYKKILEREPHARVHESLTDICRKMGRSSEARQHLEKAIEMEPDNSQFWSKLAYLLIRTGKTQEGISLLRKAVEKEPENRVIHSNLLGLLHYLPNMDTKMLFDEHKKWGLIHAPVSFARISHDNAPNPDRRLRVGYISPDFRTHAAMYFFESLLDRHNPQEVEVYGYGSVESPNEVTKRLKSKFDHYRNIYNIGDEAVVRVIEKDRIDILVDLAGHTSYNRLGVLAYKPAPIQVTYLGHPDTTGMQQIDYRLTDELANPPESQQFYTEELVSLPDGFLCYRPPDFAPPVAPLPAERKGYITFGSFNNNRKIHPSIIAIWAEILKNNSDSRFILKFPSKGDQELKDHYLRIFEQFGVSREKVEIYDTQKSFFKHLQLYSEIDIALDTYPYNGTTTTCEALWMGVPVISLAGEHHASRVALSILSRLGLEFFVASTPKDYLAKATAFASKPDALAEIRASMRARMAASTLCDAKRFTRGVEKAYRKMWHRWCQHQVVDVPSEKFRVDAQLPRADAPVCSSKSIGIRGVF